MDANDAIRKALEESINTYNTYNNISISNQKQKEKKNELNIGTSLSNK
jgi:hypothetical protein